MLRLPSEFNQVVQLRNERHSITGHNSCKEITESEPTFRFDVLSHHQWLKTLAKTHGTCFNLWRRMMAAKLLYKDDFRFRKDCWSSNFRNFLFKNYWIDNALPCPEAFNACAFETPKFLRNHKFVFNTSILDNCFESLIVWKKW